jgi:hypothetical protein
MAHDTTVEAGNAAMAGGPDHVHKIYVRSCSLKI